MFHRVHVRAYLISSDCDDIMILHFIVTWSDIFEII